MKILLIGYGKMGKAIEAAADTFNRNGADIEIIGKIRSDNAQELPELLAQHPDAAIEFTRPSTAVQHIKMCMDAGVPVVVGTTGWYEQLEEVQAYCKEKSGALLYAANFSIGVNIFFEINRHLAKLMSAHPEYQIKLEETHHTQKLDAPSGTAIKLAELIMGEIPSKLKWVNHDADEKEILPIISHRIENVPGTHSVMYAGEADSIEFIHTAHNRNGFAAGALQAAGFLAGKKGIFTMRDVLGI